MARVCLPVCCDGPRQQHPIANTTYETRAMHEEALIIEDVFGELYHKVKGVSLNGLKASVEGLGSETNV